MANFFKDYHADVKAKRALEETEKIKRIVYTKGQLVRINPVYDEERNSKRYFVENLGNGCVLLAKTRKEAINGYGYIYSECSIVNK